MSNRTDVSEQTGRYKAPGYYAKKPLYPAVIALRQVLGYQDACIQLHELSARVLESQATAQGAQREDFLMRLFREIGIPQGTFAFTDLRRVAAESYIVQTYNVVERFLRDLIAQYKDHFPERCVGWTTKDEDGGTLPPLDELLRNLPADKRRQLWEYPEAALLDYDRQLRVSIVHRTADNKRKAHKGFANLVREHGVHFASSYAELKAPKAPADVGFDDFLLFTRAVKYFSNILNDACDLSIAAITEYVGTRDTFMVAHISKERSRGAKREAANRYLKDRYSLKPADRKHVLEQVFDALYRQTR